MSRETPEELNRKCQPDPKPTEEKTTPVAKKTTHKDLRKCGKEFTAAVSLTLRYGFALLPSRAVRDTRQLTEGVHEKISCMATACKTHSTETQWEKGQQACGDLVKEESLACFRYLSNDAGADEVRRTVSKEFLTFYGTDASNVPVEQYAEHLLPHLYCCEETIIMAFVYLARAIDRGIPFTRRSAHRMLLGAVMVAVKVHEDFRFNVKYYAKVSGASMERLAKLELAMLHALDFATFVRTEDFASTSFSILSCHMQLRGAKVPWCEVAEHLTVPPLFPLELKSLPNSPAQLPKPAAPALTVTTVFDADVGSEMSSVEPTPSGASGASTELSASPMRLSVLQQCRLRRFSSSAHSQSGGAGDRLSSADGLSARSHISEEDTTDGEGGPSPRRGSQNLSQSDGFLSPVTPQKSAVKARSGF